MKKTLIVIFMLLITISTSNAKDYITDYSNIEDNRIYLIDADNPMSRISAFGTNIGVIVNLFLTIGILLPTDTIDGIFLSDIASDSSGFQEYFDEGVETYTISLTQNNNENIPVYIKKKSKADKLVDKITNIYKDINSPGDINSLIDKYGKVYISIPINDHIKIRWKNERGSEYVGILFTKSF